AYFGDFKWHVADGRAFGARKLANTVHRVMVVDTEQVMPVGREGIGLPDQAQGAAGVGGEDHRVFVRRRVEERENEGARLLVQLGHGLRSGIGRVRVAEYPAA